MSEMKRLAGLTQLLKAPPSKGSWLRVAETEGLSYNHFARLTNRQHVQTIPHPLRGSPLYTRGPDEVCAVWEFLQNCVADPHKEFEGYAMLCGAIGNVCGGYEALQLT